MVSVKNRLRLILGLLFTSISANAGVNQADIQNVDSNAYSKSCNRLLKLENKAELTNDEVTEGELLLDLISQISDEPLSYCEHVQMAGAFEDLGGVTFL